MKEISVKELRKMIDGNEAFQLIDVREPYEVEISDIGGENIPIGEIMNNLDKISKTKPVIFHCRSGARSAAVIQALAAQYGYTNLLSLRGGILAYEEEIKA